MKRTKPILIVGLLAGVAVALSIFLPDTVSRVAYAVERGQATAAREQLKEATDLSLAFEHVAKAVRPSVVNIRSVKHIQGIGNLQGGTSQLPEQFRDFFGHDFLNRFFERGAPPRGYVQQGVGTGVIVSDNGYILTNNHVVDGADEMTVTLSDDRSYNAKVVGTDPKTDLAVIKIATGDLLPAQLGDSDDIHVGEWVLALGNPFGLTETVTAGIISAKGRANVGIADYEDFIQTDAAINPGNSGGPLVDLDAKVIGITTAIATRSGGYQGIGFAIPSNMAKKIMEDIISGGKVVRGYMGAAIQNLTEDLAKSFNYHGTAGVLIGDVTKDGPAGKAGLKSGDIIIEYDGKHMKDMNQLRNSVAETKPGTEVPIEIVRDGRQETKTVKIGELEAQTMAEAGPESSENLGFTVETLTRDMAAQLGLESGQEGVVVTSVDPGSMADLAGVRPKDVIVDVGGTPVTDLASFHKAMAKQDLTKGVRMQVVTEGLKRFIFLRED
jgi:serine protease Do